MKINSLNFINYLRKLKLSGKKIIMPEKGCNSYQNISLSRSESGHENIICCKTRVNVDVLKKAKKKSLTNNFTLQRPDPL